MKTIRIKKNDVDKKVLFLKSMSCIRRLAKWGICYEMSEEESTLINIENQKMDEEKIGIEMVTQPSRRSLSRAKVFSPPNADNLASKLQLNRSQLNKIRDKKKKPESIFDEEGGEDEEQESFPKLLKASKY